LLQNKTTYIFNRLLAGGPIRQNKTEAENEN
jgi:hypothetical protein